MDSKHDIPWYRLTVTKAVGIAVLIIACGYLASIFAMREALEALSPIIHDQQVEVALKEQLRKIKAEDRLQRQLLPHLLKQEFSEKDFIQSSELKQFFASLELSNSSLLGLVQFLQGASPDNNIRWLSPTQLQVKNLLILIPFSGVKRDFDETLKLGQRYQLIRATWNDQIGPAFLRIHGVILLITFSVLAIALLILQQRYRHRIRSLITGFKEWSERDMSFRFNLGHGSDETELILSLIHI